MDGMDATGMFTRALKYKPGRPFEDLHSHLKEKFGQGGYATFNLPEAQAMMRPIQDETRRILGNEAESRRLFDKLKTATSG